MSRMSISNLLLPVSREQFTTLSAHFRKVAEQFFGGPCKLEIRAMNAVRLRSSFAHEDYIKDFMAGENRRRTFFETDDTSMLTGDIWNKAAYVEVSIRPVEEKNAPASAWGCAEFKGHLPQQATFYLQPDDATAMKSIVSGQRFKWIGEGYDSNSHEAAHPPGIDGAVDKWMSIHRRLAL